MFTCLKRSIFIYLWEASVERIHFTLGMPAALAYPSSTSLSATACGGYALSACGEELSANTGLKCVEQSLAPYRTILSGGWGLPSPT